MLRGIAYFVTYGIIQIIIWALFLRGLDGPTKIILGFIVGVSIAGLLTVLIRQGSFSDGAKSAAYSRIIRIIIIYVIVPTVIITVFGNNLTIPIGESQDLKINYTGFG